MKKVSVIIPTYKRAAFLTRAIDSVLASTYENVEIIVVDDNNAGDEYRLETEKEMNDRYSGNEKVLYLQHPVNKNGSAARNTGIRVASGDYIMFLDDDDEFFPTKIEMQVRFLDAHPEYGVCYTKYIDVMKNGKIRKGVERRQGNLLVDELSRNLFIHAGSNLMLRSYVVKEVNGFDESFARNQDIEFLIRVLRSYRIGFVDCLGLKVYLHPKSNIDYNEVTKLFISTFKDDIDSLSDEDRKRALRMIGLQLMRYNIGKRNFRKAIQVKKEYKIHLWLLTRYYCHLLKRAITRTAYGFQA